MKNSINWFEIPVKDFNRAKAFYSTLFGEEVTEMPIPEGKYGILPNEMQNGGVGGAIVEAQGYEPNTKGALVYLNGGDDLSVSLSKVEKAGGKIVLPKTSIGENGYMAHFIDSEGNKVALHSMK